RRARNRIIYSAVGAALLVLGMFAGMFLPKGTAVLNTTVPNVTVPNATVPSEPVSSAEPAAVLSANSGSVWSVSFDPKSDTVAMAVEDGTVRLWDWPTKTTQETFDAHRGVVWATQFFDDGKLLATAGDDGLLKIW